MRRIDRPAAFATLFSTLVAASPSTWPMVTPRGRGALWRTTARRARHGLDTIRLWQNRARGRQQLRTFDDHLLRDIGITRLQAETEAQKPFWRA